MAEDTKSLDISEQRWGSDYIADLLRSYDHDIVSFNPGASFRGIEESIVNYSGNDPEVITAPNESLAVSIAHGYAKATGEPGLCLLHNVVGTMNAAMSIYNAFIDRVPIVMLSGTGPMRKSRRRPWIDWIHTANVQGNIVREYTKWDDQPAHIDGVGDSIARAHEIAETRPKGPTYVTIDSSLQEGELEEPIQPPTPGDYPTPTRMAPDPEAIDEAANMLVQADMPVVVTDQVGDTRAAVEALIALAELLGAPVMDIRWQRFNFPNTHPMCLSESEVYREADVILGLDVWDINWLTRTGSNAVGEGIDEDVTFIDIG
ncbi:MAG: thiamine pyrophosphate-binding protein, partial [Halobacteriales archaeon]|nr:thiamine pyrophosphate-binding protein [Halobacteriales archaeon]